MTTEAKDPMRGIPLHVRNLFDRFSREIMPRGFRKYSADAILHRIRWHMHVVRGDREFKCNNNWTAPLARWFMAQNPQAAGFFETRERRQEAA